MFDALKIGPGLHHFGEFWRIIAHDGPGGKPDQVVISFDQPVQALDGDIRLSKKNFSDCNIIRKHTLMCRRQFLHYRRHSHDKYPLSILY